MVDGLATSPITHWLLQYYYYCHRFGLEAVITYPFSAVFIRWTSHFSVGYHMSPWNIFIYIWQSLWEFVAIWSTYWIDATLGACIESRVTNVKTICPEAYIKHICIIYIWIIYIDHIQNWYLISINNICRHF